MARRKKPEENLDRATQRSNFEKKIRKRRKRTKWINRLFGFGLGLTIFGVAAYLFVVFTTIPAIAQLRTLYIETAMSTMDHQWLATLIFPDYLVNEVVAKNTEDLKKQRNLISQWSDAIANSDGKTFLNSEDEFYYYYPELDCDSFRDYLDDHKELIEDDDYNKILFEDLDYQQGLTTAQGDKLLVVDTANNLVIVGLEGTNYYGKMAIVKDSEQVDLALSNNYGTYGEEVENIAQDNDALIAMNASRFEDVGGHGNGGTVKGALVKDHQNIGNPHRHSWKFAGFKDDGYLYVDSFKRVKASQYRWGVEVYPALIVNGENVIDGTLGMGIQPRTCIGQATNGDVLMLTIDGRQVGYSLGTDVEECAKILYRYDCCQALNLDGGSSTVMIYKGQMITKPCSVSGRGRYVPDAIIARKASAVEDSDSSSSDTSSSSDLSSDSE